MDEKYSEWCEKNIFKLFCNLSKSKIFQLALLGATAMQLGAVYLQCPPPPCRPGGELERPAEGGGAGPGGRAGRPAAWLRGAGGEAGGEPEGGGGVVGGGAEQAGQVGAGSSVQQQRAPAQPSRPVHRPTEQHSVMPVQGAVVVD